MKKIIIILIVAAVIIALYKMGRKWFTPPKKEAISLGEGGSVGAVIETEFY